MKIVMISDTHNEHRKLNLPIGDVLVHAGDCSTWGSLDQFNDFIIWMHGLNFNHKILISGNHDTMLQCEKLDEIDWKDIVYLQDQEAIIEGVTFYGSPWTPWFGDWAFTIKSEAERDKIWRKIPEHTDVLITHGPPFGILDKVIPSFQNVGCNALLKRVKEVRPKIHVFGHIHSDHGKQQIGEIRFVNASLVGENRKLAHSPVVIEI